MVWTGYTYGIAGAFWLHDAYYLNGLGARSWQRQPIMFVLSVLTFLAGAFICVAGTYVTITLIVDAYNSGCKSFYSHLIQITY